MNEWMEALLNAQWLQDMFMLILQVCMALVGLLLLPISAIINSTMPDFDDALQDLNTVFEYASQYAGWFISAFGIPPILITMILGYYTFAITSKLSFWGFKLMLKWKKAL